MFPQTKPRKPRNSSKINLLISFVFHGAIILALFFFAAREGLLGKQLKTIAVQIVREKPPEKPKETKPEPKPEPLPDINTPSEEPPAAKLASVDTPPPVQPAPPPVAAPPPASAPPAVQLPSFAFEGGRAVQSSTDTTQIFKGLVEYALRSKWNRPVDLADRDFVAEVEVAIDRSGRISDPQWIKASGHTRWDESVREAIARTPVVNRPPPTNFPERVLVRFDVQEIAEESRP